MAVVTLGYSLYLGCVFEAFMVGILALISLHSYSIFRITKEDRYKWFGLSFAVIALAFIGRIMMNLVVYTQEIRRKVAGAIIVTFKHTSASDFAWNYGLFAYQSLMLIGLIGIFLIITRSKEKKNWILMFYLVILSI